MKELNVQTDDYDDLTKDKLPFSLGRYCYSYYDESFITCFWKVVKYFLLKSFVRGRQNCRHYRLVDGGIKRVEDDISKYGLIDGKF